MSLKPLPTDEFLELSSSLEDYHKVFYAFWEMSSVMIDDRLPTACVQFFPRGQPPMIRLGEKFWYGLTFREKLFVICHESLHVILDHGMRNGMDVKGATPVLVNKAQDVVINEMIVDLFGFNRDEIRGWEKYCWIDTCFDDPSVVLRNQTFKYYLELMIKEKRDEKKMPSTVDQHEGEPGPPGDPGDQPQDSQPGDGKNHTGGMGDEETEDEKDSHQAVAEKLANELDPSDLEAMIGALNDDSNKAGTLAGMLDEILDKKRKVAKVRFDRFTKKLKRTRMKFKTNEAESFARDSRRFDDVIRSYGAILPGVYETTKPTKDRILCYAFMDVSGSCMRYWSKFQDVLFAFDKEKDIFETRCFIFDTDVVEITDSKQAATVAGGTYFHIIEDKIQELVKERPFKYPDCIIVITDGDGDAVSPEAPDRWIWFLAPNYNRRYVHRASQSFRLEQILF